MSDEKPSPFATSEAKDHYLLDSGWYPIDGQWRHPLHGSKSAEAAERSALLSQTALFLYWQENMHKIGANASVDPRILRAVVRAVHGMLEEPGLIAGLVRDIAAQPGWSVAFGEMASEVREWLRETKKETP